MPEVVFHVSYFAHFLLPVSPLPFRFFLYTLMQALLPYQDLNIAITPTNIKARTDSKYIDFISFSFEAVSTHCPPPFSVSITLFKGLFVLPLYFQIPCLRVTRLSEEPARIRPYLAWV